MCVENVHTLKGSNSFPGKLSLLVLLCNVWTTMGMSCQQTGGRRGGLREVGEVFRVVPHHGGHHREGGEGHGEEGASLLAKGALLFAPRPHSGNLTSSLTFRPLPYPYPYSIDVPTIRCHSIIYGNTSYTFTPKISRLRGRNVEVYFFDGGSVKLVCVPTLSRPTSPHLK